MDNFLGAKSYPHSYPQILVSYPQKWQSYPQSYPQGIFRSFSNYSQYLAKKCVFDTVNFSTPLFY
ncbi:hypothetical protein BN873_150233 [Candidatus Competibacter denitrificans Run_A_D11]|uniref:Uncharacterized protein n=1 Tax=Candidatus Competibacter denitrificans Run_A_D11 TaxID=1400863 RepID=W6M6W1_9GAMM|nr:hypothetical protein BN873_150233 [Candidatus Competibacter denitrificans Run_A_D11]